MQAPLVLGALLLLQVTAPPVMSTPPLDDQLSPFVRRIHQDQRGHYWFGTNGDGVARHDGERLQYFTPDQGFAGEAVRAIVEGPDGVLWFATNRGLSRFDGQGFRHWSRADGLPDDDCWALELARDGTLWVGTLQGAAAFDGESFTPFELPESPPDPSRGVTSARIVHDILEDRSGRLWFATNGGAYAYGDGEPLHLSSATGLCGDTVNDILEADDGSFWFATHHNGVCRWDGDGFEHLGPGDGVEGTEAWSLYQDREGAIWFPIENSGLYRHDGDRVERFDRSDGLASEAIQCVHQDRSGTIWAGGYGGLQRLGGQGFVPVTKRGGWPSGGGAAGVR